MNSQKPQTLDSKSHDEAAIRSLYERMMDGWNKGSGNDFAAPFTDDADFVGFDGTHLKGRQEIALFHQQLFDKFIKGSRLVGKIRSIRFLTHYIIVMVAVGGTVMAGKSDIEPERNSVHTLVAIKHDGKWHFTAFQNSRAQFIGRPEESQALTEELRREMFIA